MSHREAGRAVLLSKAHVIVVWFPRLDPAAISLLQSVLLRKTKKLRKRERLMGKKKRHAATEWLKQPRKSVLWYYTLTCLYSHGIR